MNYSLEFLQRLASRDQQAFGQLYEITSDRLYRYIAGRYRMDRQTMHDLLSDFYVKLRQHIDRLDPKLAFEARLRTMFRNFLVDYFKTKQHQLRLDEIGELEDDESISPIKYTQSAHQLEQIYAILDQLDDVSKEIVLFRYVEELSFEEIAQITNLQEDAVRQRISRAVKKIQALLGNE